MADVDALHEWKVEANRLGKAKIPFLFLLDFELKKPWICALSKLPEDVLFKLGHKKNYKLTSKKSKPLHFTISPIEYQEYKDKFDFALNEILYGNSFLLNLTIKTEIFTNYSLKELFYAAHAKYKLYFDNQFCVFSPETFIKIENNQIKTYPMKGTIDARIPDAKKQILEDKKETAEHATIVDLLRNDLSQIANDVKVNRYRFTQQINTIHNSILQVSSEIIGNLNSNFNSQIADILIKLVPAGSVSGAPKLKTLDIIQAAEQEPRGYYTGIFGIFDGKNLDSGVMIRYVENQNNRFFYRSGGGITYRSESLKEFQECLDKVYVPVNRKY
ncbi:MAG: aminodeoxychorismate synthase component I [Saprospiraceae bacterium]